jgi:hypothetical protein
MKAITGEKSFQDRVEWICCTSVYDGCLSLKNTDDIKVVQAALEYEQENYQRATMIKAIKARLRKLSRNKMEGI